MNDAEYKNPTKNSKMLDGVFKSWTFRSITNIGGGIGLFAIIYFLKISIVQDSFITTTLYYGFWLMQWATAILTSFNVLIMLPMHIYSDYCARHGIPNKILDKKKSEMQSNENNL